MDPTDPGTSGILRFLTAFLIFPFLILPPIIIMQKYLHRLPAMYAVFLTAFISLFFVNAWSLLEGATKFNLKGVDLIWESTSTVIICLIAASVASGLIIGLDRLLSNSEKKES